MASTMKFALNLVLIMFCFFLNPSLCLLTESASEVYSSLAQKHIEVLNFSKRLRTTHTSNLLQIQSNLLNFSVSHQNLETEEIKNELLKFFNDIEVNIDVLNKEFKKEYASCSSQLKTIKTVCKETPSSLTKDIKFNNDYIKELKNIVKKFDKLLANYLDSNMGYLAKDVLNIQEMNNIVKHYHEIREKLGKYFKLFKKSDAANLFLQTKTTKSLSADSVIDKFVKLYVTALSANDNKQAEFIKKRTEMAQKLFNKINLYEINSRDRKKKLLNQNKNLLELLQTNDSDILFKVNELKKENSKNSELILSLNTDNEILKSKARKCEYLENLNSKCDEMGGVYKSIVSGYEEQTVALEKIYKLLNSNKKDEKDEKDEKDKKDKKEQKNSKCTNSTKSTSDDDDDGDE